MSEKAGDRGFDKYVEFAKEGLMMPGSKTFEFAVEFNQMADFASRYVLFHHMTEQQGIDKETAINRALDDFVFYDEPTDPWIQAANDYGFIMFSKFFLRAQRVWARLLKEKPATALATSAIDSTIVGEQGIDNYFLSPEKLFNRFYLWPPGNIMNVFETPNMAWLAAPFTRLAL